MSAPHAGWQLHEAGPAGADHTVLMIPGGMCTAAFYDDVLAEPALRDASLRCVAVTVPGFGDARPAGELTIEGLARQAGALAAELGCDAVVGHSIGANIALEMVAAGEFSGPVLLLEPAFSREDEFKEIALLDRLGRIPGIGHMVWAGALRSMGSAMKDEFPPERHDTLVAEMKKCDAGFCRRMVRHYFAYLDRHGSLVSRLCGSGARALVVFCDRSEVGLTDDERAGLEACETVTLVDVADSGHMVMTDQPARTAELVLEALAAHTIPA